MKNIYLLIICFLITSCGLFLNKTSNFKIYKKAISNSDVLPFKTNGLYASIDKKSPPIIFYNNGMIKNYRASTGSSFWANPSIEALNLYSDDIEYKNFKEYFGCFLIRGDTILVESFNLNSQEKYRRWIYKGKFLIENDTILKLVSDVSTLSNYQLVKKPIFYKFYPFEKKPDSTKAWFYHKKWYKKGLHPSRQ